MKLIAGLGNPGAVYEKTRHNAGFMAVDFLLERYGLTMDTLKDGAGFVSSTLCGVATGFIKPVSYMNLSGEPIGEVMNKLLIEPENLLVIHDDMDITTGKVKYKISGGSAGHKGLISIIENIGSPDFHRIRIGIDRPDDSAFVTEHVLSRFSDDQSGLFMNSLDKIVELVENRFLVS